MPSASILSAKSALLFKHALWNSDGDPKTIMKTYERLCVEHGLVQRRPLWFRILPSCRRMERWLLNRAAARSRKHLFADVNRRALAFRQGLPLDPPGLRRCPHPPGNAVLDAADGTRNSRVRQVGFMLIGTIG